jgi:hypothetical protein
MLRFVQVCTLAALCAFAGPAAAVETYDNDGNAVDFATGPARRLPVLLVHGHAPDDADNPNYRKNWWDRTVPFVFEELTSFKATLGLNPDLDIEPYYIRFADHTRSIVNDAREIAEAVDLIVARHNPAYAAANPNFATTDPPGAPPVQLVIIGYSKGTISTRLYLKTLVDGDAGATPPRLARPRFRPVSEFIAISPPNHGLALAPLGDDPFDNLSLLPVQQLYNGVQPIGSTCGEPFDPMTLAGAENFIERLNGETGADLNGHVVNGPNEAPGSRTRDQLPHQGTLYVTLFDTRDMVNAGSGDCRGRGRAANFASAAENVVVTGVPGFGPRVIHAATVHFFDVVCKALFAVVHHASPAEATCASHPQDSLTPVIPLPEPAAAMLALDISGSMGLPTCPGCAATRLDVLKQSVTLFAELWLMMGRANDRLGVTYFDTTVTPVGGGTLHLLTRGNVDTILTELGTKSPANLTAMGGALQVSIGALSELPMTSPRHVILFTDGMQNVSPMVHEVAAGQQDIRADPTRPQSNVTPTGTRLDMLGGIIVDTIGIGTVQSFLDLLAAISAQTHGPNPTDPSGLTRATANAEDLRQFFVEALIDTLRGSSPQLIAYRRGALGSVGTASEAFTANRGGRKLLFKVSWPPGQRLEVRAFKENTDVTATARTASGAFYCILAFDAPARGSADALSGAWRLSITGPRGVAYQAAAIMDEPDLSYRVRLTEPRLRVGSPLTFVVEVKPRKRPLDGRMSVTATVEQPRIAIANLIGDARPPDPEGRGFEPGMTAAERQVVALAIDAERWKALTTPRRATIRLKGDRNGVVRGTLGSVTIPGIYRATVRISGEDRRLGRFERTESVTAIVRFGAAERRKSELALRARDGSFDLTLRPRDRHGNLLGPGLPGEIRLADRGGKDAAKPEDLGGGRYRFIVTPESMDRPLTLSVGERPLFMGGLKELLPAPRRR